MQQESARGGEGDEEYDMYVQWIITPYNLLFPYWNMSCL